MSKSRTAVAAVLIAGATALPFAVAPASAVAAPSASVARTLQFNGEEERLARDLYVALSRVHDGARPMSNNTRSEQRHHDALGRLLTRYGISDPSAGRAPGSYAFPELQKLYDGWYARGKTSLKAAYQVGVELEKRDIDDLTKARAAARDAAVKRVYSNLLSGSENHLAAFQRAASGTRPCAAPAPQDVCPCR